MGGARARGLAAAAATAFALLAAAVAQADAVPVATLTAEAPISAGHGWLVWSVPGRGGWLLDGLHDGRVVQLPVAARRGPFDANVGTNAAGAPVVTFSRCRLTAKMQNAGLFVEGSGTLVEPNTGAGCSVRVLELDSGRERRPAIPAPRGASDTTPAMWHGTIAFARKAPGHGRVSQVMLWSPREPSRLLVLPHGAVPQGCPGAEGCREFPAGGEVQALSIDAQAVAFVWRPLGPDLGDGAWEERVDSLATHGAALAGTAGLSESCTGDSPVEEEWPAPPLLDGPAVLFPGLLRGGCYTIFGANLLRYDDGTRLLGKLSVPVVEMAKDGAATYGLIAQVPTDEQDPGCSPALPCSLQLITAPALRPTGYRPTHPFGY